MIQHGVACIRLHRIKRIKTEPVSDYGVCVFVQRAIVWLQNRREATMERTRPSTTVRRDEPGEFRVGRLKHERVKVPRGESMMEWAESVMHVHADRKSVLEVERCQCTNIQLIK